MIAIDPVVFFAGANLGLALLMVGIILVAPKRELAPKTAPKPQKVKALKRPQPSLSRRARGQHISSKLEAKAHELSEQPAPEGLNLEQAHARVRWFHRKARRQDRR